MAHVLLFPSEMETKGSGKRRRALPLSLGTMIGFLRSVLTDYVFYEPITLDRRLPCVKAGAHWGKKKKKDSGVGMRALVCFA